MMNTLLISIAVLSLQSTPSDRGVPPGELPVDPYTISNENAGATPYGDDRLYRALNGEEGIDRIVEDFVDRISNDPRLAKIFVASDLVRLRRTLSEQLCFLAGGPCEYTGRDMASSHRDHGITTREFNIVVEALQAAMHEEGVSFRAQNRLLARLAPMHRDVVTR